MSTSRPHSGTQTTTVRLPKSLYDKAKRAVAEGNLSSLNDLIVTAVRAYLRFAERRRIDAAFAQMADDVRYQDEAKLIAEQFGPSDWEAIELADQDLQP